MGQSISRYRKKAVEIEAFQLTQDYSSVHAPSWFLDAIKAGTIDVKIYGKDVIVHIRTLEGRMTANIGDWIIKGVVGELYPCRDDIFKMTYEPVEEEQEEEEEEPVVTVTKGTEITIYS